VWYLGSVLVLDMMCSPVMRRVVQWASMVLIRCAHAPTSNAVSSPGRADRQGRCWDSAAHARFCYASLRRMHSADGSGALGFRLGCVLTTPLCL